MALRASARAALDGVLPAGQSGPITKWRESRMISDHRTSCLVEPGVWPGFAKRSAIFGQGAPFED